jgi:GNAT superfamily N-acetyltransferase
MEIREATQSDNAPLKELQTQCPMGTSLVVTAVNTPDFFARARAYSRPKILVASEGDRIAGTGACAVERARIRGNPETVGYEFQFFTSPEFRRTGVASTLHRYIESYLSENGAILTYCVIMEGNVPSIRLIESHGFKKFRTLAIRSHQVYRQMEVPSTGTIRTATKEDLGAITNLMEGTWGRHELYRPRSPQDLEEFVVRTPELSYESLWLLETEGELQACAGLWDWSKITRMTIDSRSRTIQMMGLAANVIRLFRPMPRSIRPGETIRQAVLTPLAFRSPDSLRSLLVACNNRALERGNDQMLCVAERDDPIFEASRGFIHVDTELHLYIKTLVKGIKISDGPVYLDGIDL